MSFNFLQFDIVNVARIMKVDFHGAIPNWSDFDSAMLCPLRLQMMGSVVVSSNITRVCVYNYVCMV